MSKKEYGKYEVEGALDLKKAKVKVTIYIDGDVLERAKSEAKLKHTKYQTLINSLLRETLMTEKSRLDLLEERVLQLEAASSS